MTTPPPVKVKKVSAYPIAVILKLPTANMNAQIVRLTPQGFLAEVPPSNLQPGDKLDVTFQVPVLKNWVNEASIMIKLYSQWGGSGGTPKPPTDEAASKTEPAGGPLTFGSPTAEGRSVVHLVEIHFQHPTEVSRTAIAQFLRTIRQK